jgi:hypothetical protein
MCLSWKAAIVAYSAGFSSLAAGRLSNQESMWAQEGGNMSGPKSAGDRSELDGWFV